MLCSYVCNYVMFLLLEILTGNYEEDFETTVVEESRVTEVLQLYSINFCGLLDG